MTPARLRLLAAADSYAGGLLVRPVRGPEAAARPLPERDGNGAPIDGQGGTATPPFLAAPDQDGRALPFAVAWAAHGDMEGGVVARAHGLNAERLPVSVQNTDIYRMIYATLFGVWLE